MSSHPQAVASEEPVPSFTDPARVTVQLVPADLERFSRQFGVGVFNWKGLVLFIIAVALMSTAAFFKDSKFRGDGRDRYSEARTVEVAESQPWDTARVVTSAIPFVVFAAILAFFFWRQKRAASGYEEYSPGILKEHSYELLDRGVLCRSEDSETINHWRAIHLFTESKDDLYILLAARSGHVLPKRCFPSLEAMAIFRNQLETYLERHNPAALPRE